MSLGLPPVSVGLKSIAPYLHRAEELVEREPVVAYWCAYYAAQLGISLKTQDTNSHKLLLGLLDALERLKKEIGPDDTIDIEPASAAYVENFALKVFKSADDEDRAGNATKSIAKKFLVAANFFEVLRVFPKTDISESSESKLKYAKWKAVDIAKALREGRRPTPGPAGSQLDPELASSLPVSDQFDSEQHPPTPPRPVPREPSPPTKSSSRSPKRHSPPPAISPADIARANRLHLGEDKHDNEALSPGRWSTTATPGFDLARTSGLDSTAGSSDSMNNWHEHIVDPMTRAEAHAGSSKLRTAWVSTEMEGAASDDEHVEDFTLSRGRVRFSLDTPGRSSPPSRASASPLFLAQDVASPPLILADLPPGFVPTGVPSYAPAAEFGSPRAGSASFVVSPPPPVPAFPAPPMSSIASPTLTDSILVPAYPPPREAELTPKAIAKAQKHCRFAISALDYEDPQHAIRELRAALETLGASV
ncbi:Vta1 like-domain-containing protein [Boletus reticuloceps]|uniref:Vta1 like-domain-containing protein n=1 Tax=Boletus reticuloceps TaxID=495285 RepID=A0A8I2Z220_9AGAM|nr:Vta1 like-domain-containing protein [Boletus reticuloceps]